MCVCGNVIIYFGNSHYKTIPNPMLLDACTCVCVCSVNDCSKMATNCNINHMKLGMQYEKVIQFCGRTEYCSPTHRYTSDIARAWRGNELDISEERNAGKY